MFHFFLFVFVSHLDLFQDAIEKDGFLKRELRREDVPLVNLDCAPGGRSSRPILTCNPIKQVAVSII